MDPLGILASAQRCNASYVEGMSASSAAFTQLGMEFIAQYQTATHQATLSKNTQGGIFLTIAGTRISEGNNVDLIDDVWLAPQACPKGGVVPAGVYAGMTDFWRWVFANIPQGANLTVEGHSLGAERVLLTPLFFPGERINDLFAFEAPQCGTQEYWDAYRDVLGRAVQTVCGADIWFGWPPAQGYVHDAQAQLLWVKPTGVSKTTTAQWKSTYTAWPIGLNYPDHQIVNVIKYLQAAIQNGTFTH